MGTDSLHPSVCRENALNALTEIRAYHSDFRTLVVGAFDRLDKLVDEFRSQKIEQEQAQPGPEREMMQDQIDQLARLAHDLAQSVAEHKQLTANRLHAQPKEAAT
jgi:hypothetical protein